MLLLLILTILVIIPTPGLAQGPGFDPDCYFPRVGVAGEIDTIYGSQSGQEMGAGLQGIGPVGDSPYQSLVMRGLPKAIPFLTEVQGGPNFNLNTLRTATKRANIGENALIIKRGPFREPGQMDALVLLDGRTPYIYWADSNNELSTNRRTLLNSSVRGKVVTYFQPEFVYATYLTNDSVMDVVTPYSILDVNQEPYPWYTYVMLYKGGESLYVRGDTAFEDEGVRLDSIGFWGYASQGDWRGTGREDLILAQDNGDGFFYRNEQPFNLARLVSSLQKDTLWANWQYPMDPMRMSRLQRTFCMRAFYKPKWNTSVDFMPMFPRRNDDYGNIWMFKGGPDFGRERLRIDSPDYMIKHPSKYGMSGVSFGPGMIDCGDMSGSGNRVLGVGGLGGGSGFTGIAFFYVTGKALDDKIDMFYSEGFFFGGPTDTVTIAGDALPGVMIGSPAFTSEADALRNKESVGTVHILHGSTRIPVRINPDMGSVYQSKVRGTPLVVYPSPAEDRITLYIEGHLSPNARVEIRDILGRLVHETQIAIPSSHEMTISLPNLPDGSYEVTLIEKQAHYTTKISVIQ